MGILNACTAREFGAKTVILAEVNENRLKQAGAFGIDVLVNPGSENLTEVVLNCTDGIGADVVIVAAPAAVPGRSTDLCAQRGTVCLFRVVTGGQKPAFHRQPSDFIMARCGLWFERFGAWHVEKAVNCSQRPNPGRENCHPPYAIGEHLHRL